MDHTIDDQQMGDAEGGFPDTCHIREMCPSERVIEEFMSESDHSIEGVDLAIGSYVGEVEIVNECQR